MKQATLISARLWVCLAPLLILSQGCNVFQGVMNAPKRAIDAFTPSKKQEAVENPVTVERRLQRFADEFTFRTISGVEALQRETNVFSPVELLHWKIALLSETVSIISGPNAIANLLDMTVFATVARATLEDYWQPKVFGAAGQGLLETCRSLETEIWSFANSVLNPEQMAELHAAIERWRKENPLPEGLLNGRALGVAAQITQNAHNDLAKPGTLLNLLMLDPFTGLDPATREIAQTRLFAERALYMAQKMPWLLRWQTELLSLNALATPPVQQLMANSTQFVMSLDRLTGLAERWPAQISAEREAILAALQVQEKELTPLLNEVRQALTAGSQMSTSVNTTVTTFDALMKRFGVGENRPGPTNETPFRIQDYGQTASQLESTARQLTELLLTLDRTLGSTNVARISEHLTPAVQQAQNSGQALVDYAFWRGLLLVGAGLIAALIYRALAPYVARTAQAKATPLAPVDYV